MGIEHGDKARKAGKARKGTSRGRKQMAGWLIRKLEN
jgi:hypothetical protein